MPQWISQPVSSYTWRLVVVGIHSIANRISSLLYSQLYMLKVFIVHHNSLKIAQLGESQSLIYHESPLHTPTVVPDTKPCFQSIPTTALFLLLCVWKKWDVTRNRLPPGYETQTYWRVTHMLIYWTLARGWNEMATSKSVRWQSLKHFIPACDSNPNQQPFGLQEPIHTNHKLRDNEMTPHCLWECYRSAWVPYPKRRNKTKQFL